jgi:hypothetical protein
LGDFIETKVKKLPTSPGLVSPAVTSFVMGINIHRHARDIFNKERLMTTSEK